MRNLEAGLENAASRFDLDRRFQILLIFCMFVILLFSSKVNELHSHF